MTRYWVLFAGLLLGCQTVAPTVEDDPLLTRSTTRATVRRLIKGPAAQLRTSLVDLTRAFGQPSSVSIRETPNKHDSSVVDRIEMRKFRNALVEVYVPGGVGDGFLSSLSVEAAVERLRLPVRVGAHRRAVIAALGEPDHSSGNIFEYQEEVSYANRSLDTVRLYFDGDRLARIEWIYWIE